MDVVNLKAPDYYLNRELSFLEFNQRVLDLAQDASVPLLERVKFLSISCSNLDEFFEIRVAGLKERQELGVSHAGPDGRSPVEQLEAIHLRAQALVAEQYRLLNDVLVPALLDAGIHLVRPNRLTDAQARALESYFEHEVEPVLSPLGLDPARPFPKIQNKSLNFIVKLSGTDAFGRETNLAIVQVPRSLPRVVRVPSTDGDGGFVQLAYLSTVVQRFIGNLFEGVTVEGCWQFRVTRNSDLFVDEEEVDDLRRAVEGELAQRRYGDEVRLETAHDCPSEITGFLLQQFQLGPTDLYQVHGPVNLNRLMAVYDLVDRPELKFPPFTPGVPERIVGRDLFAAIREKDVLLHHPYHSFAPVVDFVRTAARDPQVLAIKQTLYRSGPDSAIVDALVEAAKNGKDVTVIVELMARFDEAANIMLATRLQEAGAHVMYGVVGYKTHAKLSMIVRREDGALRRYCHVATGNYHAKTARTYEDYGLLTCSESIGQDLHDVFLQLTSLTRVPKLKKLLQSPFTLHDSLVAKIAREAQHAREGRPARIIAKMNSLLEPGIIEALYEASNAGVEIDLIVRGTCTLRPGIPRVSDRIRVRSIVGRFLEHSRVFHFLNDGGEEEVWCASADWMDRNFFRRVEVAFPVEDHRHRERILRDLECYLADNTNAWVLSADGVYERLKPNGQKPFSAQQALLQRHADG
jgi:polyphosphate kinase